MSNVSGVIKSIQDIMRKRKLPHSVDSSKLEFPRRADARGNALAAGFPARRVA